MPADPTGTWTYARTDIEQGAIGYHDGVWVRVGRENGTTDGAIAISTDPTASWTRQQTIAGVDFRTVTRVIYADGRWAFVAKTKIYHSTDDWASYTATTPTFQGVTNAQELIDIAYGDSTWVVTRVPPSGGSWARELQYATTLTGTWTRIQSSSLSDTRPNLIAYNGSRWAIAGVSTKLDSPTGSVFATSTTLTGTWSVPSDNVLSTSVFITYYATSLEWSEEFNQWFAGVTPASSTQTPYYAPADASSWKEFGFTRSVNNIVRGGNQSWAAGDDYVVTFGGNPSNPERLGYLATSSFASSGTVTVVTDATTNTSGRTTENTLDAILFADNRFILAGRPSTQSYYGTMISEGGAEEFGWGLLL